jgi:hypothetical protein
LRVELLALLGEVGPVVAAVVAVLVFSLLRVLPGVHRVVVRWVAYAARRKRRARDGARVERGSISKLLAGVSTSSLLSCSGHASSV